MAKRVRRMPTAATKAVPATKERAAWLFRFANSDLGDAGEPEIRDRSWQIFDFASDPPGDLTQARRLRERGAVRSEAARPMERINVRAIHSQLRHAIGSLVERGQCLVLPEGRTAQGVQRREDGAFEFYTGGNHEIAFFGAALQLLAKLGPRVRRCAAPGCGRFFGASRPQQVYCDPGCSQRVRDARFKELHPGLIPERKHAAYVRRRRRVLGRRVKVARRRRQRQASA